MIIYTYIFPVTYGNMTLLAFLEAMALVEGVKKYIYIYICMYVYIEFMAILDVSGVKETSEVSKRRKLTFGG